MNSAKPSQPIQCVIFDCDGVLVDSEILANQTALQMLEPYGFVMSQAEYGGSFAGKTEADILEIVRRDYGIKLPDDFHERLSLAIERRIDQELRAIVGMREVITSLLVPTAVVSNSRLVRVISSLKVAGLSDLFGDNLFAAEMVDHPKPAPDIYLHAVRKLGAPPSACLVIEDSQSGITAAHRAGMPVIGFLGASHLPADHEKTAKAAGAWAVADSAAELSQLLRTLSFQS